MNDFKVLIQAVLDSGSIGQNDIAKIQKVINKYHVNLAADLDSATILAEIKKIVPQLEAELKKTTGINIKINDSAILKSINQINKEINSVATKASNIKILVGENGNTTTQIQTIANSFSKLGLSSDDVKQKMAAVNSEFLQLKSVMASGDNSAIVNQFSKLQSAITGTKNNLATLRSEYNLLATSQQRMTMANTIEAWNQKNTKATRSVITANEEYIRVLRDVNTQMSKMQFNNITNGFKSAENSMRSIGKLGASIKNQFNQAISSFSMWISASSAVMLLLTKIRQIPEAVKELNEAITDLTMATGASQTQLESYIKSYAKLADKLSSTVTDVTTSATTWLKQGQSIADTETLITNSMILSKVGSLESAEATEYLTSAMKGYGVAAEDTLGVVDKLSAVDMASATDVGGLAEAMSEVAANAELSGVSMDKLLSYLATVGEVTQENMSEVGTTFNAIFSRMGNIKLSRLTDYETGESLSDVETVLNGLDIKLRDTNDTFRDFDNVLDEVGGNWSNYSDTQQRAIAKAFAGTNHMNEFIVLMENYGTSLKYTETSLGSSGEAMEKFSAYEDSIAGHTEKAKNAWIVFANTLLDSGVIKFFSDFGGALASGLTGITNLISPLGTLGAVLGTVLGAKNLGRCA